ncbi:GTP cyclohydrolase I FolE [Candidatus Poribacteria bacterium]|nr:GTP cyclohydrolase I FolE [Candidatus Poribacteria bacterium]
MNAQSVEKADLFEEKDLEKLYEQILQCIGEEVQREGLIKTPRRAADAMKFMTQGYRQNLKSILNGAIFDSDSDDIVIVRDIEFYSLCEHHILPFFGKCHVGYIPNGKIIGLSKIPRIVDMFARRLQVQERLTHQIAHALNQALNPLGVAVVMEAQHMCMMIRGVQKQNSKAITSSVLGVFRDDPSTKAEWMSLLQIS